MCVFVEKRGKKAAPLIYSTGSITSVGRLQLQAIKSNHPIRLIFGLEIFSRIFFTAQARFLG